MAVRHWKFVPFERGRDYLDGAVKDGVIRASASDGRAVCYCDEEDGRQIEKLIAENQRLKKQVKKLKERLDWYV